MSDFNGRVREITRTLEQNPDDPGEVRFVIRKVLRAERMDGWQEGYSDGQEDRFATTAHQREKAATALQYSWRGTDRRGADSEGAWQMSPRHLAAVVEDRFETGWRALRVTQDGTEVAGISPHPEKPGETHWWTGDNS
jgi:hypothetical protein